MMSTVVLKSKIQGRNENFLIMFDDMIPDMISDKNFSPVVSELFISGRKLNNSLGFYHTIIFSYIKYEIQNNT